MTTLPKPRDCPLCGPPKIDEHEVTMTVNRCAQHNYVVGHTILCPNCGLTMDGDDDGEDLLETWNRRKYDTVVHADLMEQIAKVTSKEPLTYNWVHHSDIPMSHPERSDFDVAGEVRMLTREQLNHEAVCTMARDRIMALSKRLSEYEDLVQGVSKFTEEVVGTMMESRHLIEAMVQKEVKHVKANNLGDPEERHDIKWWRDILDRM